MLKSSGVNLKRGEREREREREALGPLACLAAALSPLAWLT